MNYMSLRLPRVFTPYQRQPFNSRRSIQSSFLQLSSSPFHSTGDIRSKKRNFRDCFSSSALRFIQQDAKPEKRLSNTEDPTQKNKRKSTRSKTAKNSLRRVAVEAQRSRDGNDLKKTSVIAHQATSKVGHS